jgi:bifunctional DNA-binding transcriptional regulator/antitoxin component of YhaV-PrlF toxin-antitoxin module
MQWPQMGIYMHFTSRLTGRGHTTVPKRVREVLKVRPGDLLAYETYGDCVVVKRVEDVGHPHLRALQSTLSESNSHSDAESYDTL